MVKNKCLLFLIPFSNQNQIMDKKHGELQNLDKSLEMKLRKESFFN